MSTQSQPHPRAALRNRNLPKLPDFEFPRRTPSPQPPSPQQAQRRAPPPPTQQQRSSPERSSSPIPTPQYTADQSRAQLDSEISYQNSKRNTPAKELWNLNQAKGFHSQAQTRAKGTAGSQRVVEGFERKDKDMAISDMSQKGQWIFYAIASGACAAVNGVFAKLTTTEVTTNFATFLANLIGLEKGEKVFEFLVRAVFFLLNLLFNAIMWALFTKALSRGPGTTQVSILNTSSNFMLTALMGFIIFSESLPALWWLGAAMLVAGNVIIGRREESEVDVVDGEGEGIRAARRSESGSAGYRDLNEEGRALLGEDIELSETESEELKRKRIAREVVEDILDLEPPQGSTR